jgi:Rad3-related DNA helicase
MRTIETFQESNKRYLLVASAEYGADFTWCECQFVLKVPYATLDDRMRALERKMGKDKFKRWYVSDAINRLIQQCGRVGRGYDSFGCTFILDSKFKEVFKQNGSAFPQWFKDRLNVDVME